MKPKTIALWTLFACVASTAWITVRNGRKIPEATYSQFLQQVRGGEVSGVSIASAGSAAEATYQRKDGATVRTVLPADYRDALAILQDKPVNIEIREPSPWFALRNAVPFLLLLALWIVLMFRLRNHPHLRGLG